MMSGSEHSLKVFLGKTPIASLMLFEDQLRWQYNKCWQQAGYPISPHLPLNKQIPATNVQRFLRNLLPEGIALEELISSFHLSKYNTFGLIGALGLDTPGSLVFIPKVQTTEIATTFRKISKHELTERLDNRENFSLIFWDGKPRLSVAGVQDKINVVLNDKQQLGFGEGNLCSTHILKFERQRLSHLVINEYLSMILAKQCGINVAETKLMRFGNNPALLVKRFDRQFKSESEVKRRHIIDGCQALNMPPEFKYERNFGSGKDVQHIRDGVSLEKIFHFADFCDNPALCKQQIIDWVMFNILIFNFDAHGKNISFFVGANGISLAPFYDLVNIKLYAGFEHDLAMAIGDEFSECNIHAYQLADFADSCGISRTLVTNRLRFIAETLDKSLYTLPDIAINSAETAYLQKYQVIVKKRCQQLLKEAAEISFVKL